jgi:LPXTG-motif cell wall-anchored protein
MNAPIRFLTGGLASVAVASAVTMTAPSAFAEDGPARPCGHPAVPAVFVTVVHDPELRVVPAVTHEEWRWQREVTSFEYEFSRLVSRATTEYLWSHKVVDQPAVPAVPGTPEQGHHVTVVVTPAVIETEFEYVQQQTGMTRWERDGWNGEHAGVDDGKGWLKTGNTREDVVTPAVTEDQWVVDQPATPGTPAIDEVSHQETAWSETSPGGEWTGPLDSRTIPAVVDTLWAVDAPDGYTATGASRVHDVTTEESDDTSAAPPDGDGWSAVADSRVVVDDVAEHTELVGESYTEQVLASPAIPASDPCPETVGSDTVDGPADEGATGTSSAVDAAHGSAAVASSATILPATGNPASPWLVAAGAGALVAGSVLVRAGRRRRTS